MSRAVRFIALFFIIGIFVVAAGCSRPAMPSLVGTNMFHDLSQVRKGMSPNEVRKVMGSNYENKMEEGIHGMDGGYYTWVYPEGKVFFNYDGVTGVEAK
ncbi:MAG TPA: hypothetical protein VKX17_02420 [Planctomycetota bacterium]|nr:hypothetical protein [Planctomycetota bacterium]